MNVSFQNDIILLATGKSNAVDGTTLTHYFSNFVTETLEVKI